MTKEKKRDEEVKNDEVPQEETPKQATETNWEEKAGEYLNDLKRTQADFENYKKRQATQQKDLGAYLIEKLVMDIVPVMDNFRMATEHVPEEQRSSPWVTGIQYIEKQLEKVLSENGVETIEVKVGDTFNPSMHEAVSTEQEATNGNEETAKEHKIVKVVQNGYRIGDKMIRAAKVIVG